jgi:hypothetical protein
LGSPKLPPKKEGKKKGGEKEIHPRDFIFLLSSLDYVHHLIILNI